MNNISPINGLNTLASLQAQDTSASSVTATNSFETLLKDAISEVNNSQVEGYNAMSDIATGKVTNLQEAVQKIEEAELSLKLALEVKNKALGAYKEIMRMQV